MCHDYRIKAARDDRYRFHQRNRFLLVIFFLPANVLTLRALVAGFSSSSSSFSSSSSSSSALTRLFTLAFALTAGLAPFLEANLRLGFSSSSPPTKAVTLA